MARTLAVCPFPSVPVASPCETKENASLFLRWARSPVTRPACFHPRLRRSTLSDFSSSRRIRRFSSSELLPVHLAAIDGDEEETASVSPSDSVPATGDDVYIQIKKSGKNRRQVRARIRISAGLQDVWGVLTDYERLPDFIPGLAVCRLIERRGRYVRMFQIGQQSFAFGIKFNAKGTMDCSEKDMEHLPFGNKRDIDFTMVEGDFPLFEGKWSLVQAGEKTNGSSSSETQNTETFLSYIVDVEPHQWLPVALVEKRLCSEIELNLVSIRKEVERRPMDSRSVSS